MRKTGLESKSRTKEHRVLGEKELNLLHVTVVAIGCCMAVPNESDFLMMWESIFRKDKLWIYFLRVFLQHGA